MLIQEEKIDDEVDKPDYIREEEIKKYIEELNKVNVDRIPTEEFGFENEINEIKDKEEQQNKENIASEKKLKLKDLSPNDKNLLTNENMNTEINILNLEIQSLHTPRELDEKNIKKFFIFEDINLPNEVDKDIANRSNLNFHADLSNDKSIELIANQLNFRKHGKPPLNKPIQQKNNSFNLSILNTLNNSNCNISKKNVIQPSNKSIEKIDLKINLKKNLKDNKYINYSNTNKKKIDPNIEISRNNNNNLFNSRHSKKNTIVNQSLDSSKITSCLKKKVEYTSSKLSTQNGIKTSSKNISLPQKNIKEDSYRKNEVSNKIPFSIKNKGILNYSNKDNTILNNSHLENKTSSCKNKKSDSFICTLSNQDIHNKKEINGDNIITVLNKLYGSNIKDNLESFPKKLDLLDVYDKNDLQIAMIKCIFNQQMKIDLLEEKNKTENELRINLEEKIKGLNKELDKFKGSNKTMINDSRLNTTKNDQKIIDKNDQIYNERTLFRVNSNKLFISLLSNSESKRSFSCRKPN